MNDSLSLTLIGAALGPFLLGIGFWLKQRIMESKERKEYMRRIEISITHSLDSTYKMRLQLREIVKRIKGLATAERNIKDNKTFSLSRINFPPIREVYRDVETPYFKIKSYYLHNKLLWADAGIKEVNDINVNFKNDFVELIRQNELLISLIKENPNPNPIQQRLAYVSNLESFASVIEEYIDEHIPQVIQIMTQIKVYNSCLRKRWFGCWFLWKNEKVSFKYFRNKTKFKEFSGNLDSLARIDKIIQKEVDLSISEVEKRSSSGIVKRLGDKNMIILIKDTFMTVLKDKEIITLRWKQETEKLVGETFKQEALKFIEVVERERAKKIMVDMRDFKFQLSSELITWRNEYVISVYNRIGAEKFAFISNTEPVVKQDDSKNTFVTRHFQTEEDAEVWLNEA